MYLNLIMLSAASATNTNSFALVYSLIGIVFVTMFGIILYHFHLQFVRTSIKSVAEDQNENANFHPPAIKDPSS